MFAASPRPAPAVTQISRSPGLHSCLSAELSSLEQVNPSLAVVPSAIGQSEITSDMNPSNLSTKSLTRMAVS